MFTITVTQAAGPNQQPELNCYWETLAESKPDLEPSSFRNRAGAKAALDSPSSAAPKPTLLPASCSTSPVRTAWAERGSRQQPCSLGRHQQIFF